MSYTGRFSKFSERLLHGTLQNDYRLSLDHQKTRRVRRSEAILRQAAECVSRGQTFQTVSDMFDIPISTIRFFMARKGILPRRKRGRSAGAAIIERRLPNDNLSNVNNASNSGISDCSISTLNPSGSPSDPPFQFSNYKMADNKSNIL